MKETINRILIFVACATCAFPGLALTKTLMFDRIPDKYTHVFSENDFYNITYNFGKVIVDCSYDTNYRQDYKEINVVGSLYIKNLPFIYSYTVNYGATSKYLSEKDKSSFALRLYCESNNGAGASVKGITLRYGEDFKWEDFRYTLLTDETATVVRPRYDKTELIVPSVLPFEKEGFYDVAITAIDKKAFYGLENLEKVTLPATIKEIGALAFSCCAKLNTVTVESTTPPTLSQNAFDAASIANFAVYVPAQSYEAYKNAPVWMDLNIIPIGEPTMQDGFGFITTSGGSAVMTSFGEDMESAVVPSYVTINGLRYKVYLGLLPSNSYSNLKSLYVEENVDIQNLSATNVPNLKKLFYLGTSAPNMVSSGISSLKNSDLQIYGVNNDAIVQMVEQTGGTACVYPMLKNKFISDGIVYIPTSTGGRTCDAVDYDYTTVNPIIGENASYRNVVFKISNINPYIFHQARIIESISVNNSLPLPETFARETNVHVVNLKCGEIPTESFVNSLNLSSVAINSVGDLGEKAFANMGKNLTDQGAVIEINNVGAIGNMAFHSAGRINRLYVGGNVTEIKSSAFENAFSGDGLGVVKIECNGVINQKAFFNTKNIHTLSISETVTEISTEAFRMSMCCDDANAILNAHALGNDSFRDNSGLKTVEIGSQCTGISQNAFADNPALNRVTVGNGCESIGNQVFMNDTALENVSFGDGVTTIGNEVFKGATSLRDVIFGSKLKSLGDYVFDNCAALEALTVKAKEPPTCGTYNFRHVNTWNCKLYVPKGSERAYLAAPQWQDFMCLAEFSLPGDVDADGKVTAADVQDIINYILGNVIDGFDNDAADINKDGEISLGDAVSAQNLANSLNIDVNVPLEGIVCSADDLSINGGKPGGVSIKMSNTELISAFQFDINVPDGLTISNIRLNNHIENHQIYTSNHSEGLTRVVCHSDISAQFSYDTDIILMFDVEPADLAVKDYTISLENIKVSDATGTQVDIAPCSLRVNVEEVAATSVVLNQKSVVIKAGDTLALTAKVLPDYATHKTVTWTSDNEAVATVDAFGNITAVAKGSASITAACGLVSAICEVTVDYTNATDIIVPTDPNDPDYEPELAKIFTEGLSMLVDDTKFVKLKVDPITANPTMVWNSSNNEVVTVDNGLVKAIGEGEASITVASGEFNKDFKVVVNRHNQTLIWDQTLDGIKVDESIELTAEATSGLMVDYVVLVGQASVSGTILSIAEAGKITLEANQSGNRVYAPAEPVRRTFNSESGINVVSEDGSSVRIIGSEVVIEDGNYELYTISGMLVCNGKAPGRIILQRGTPFILHVNGKIVKLLAM